MSKKAVKNSAKSAKNTKSANNAKTAKSPLFKNFIAPMIVLVAICAVIGVAMAAVNFVTAPKIEEAQKQKEEAALSAVVPNNKGFELVDMKLDGYESVVSVYSDKGSKAIAVMLSIKGYDSSNPMSVAVGFDENGNIIKTSVISCSGETKGIGSKVAEEGFLSRFTGKSDVSGVDTISGATISSEAFREAINEACAVAKQYRATEVTK